jgi:hypothetical protein
MADLSNVQAGMTVIGANDTHVGKVAGVDGDRIRLEPTHEGEHGEHSHYIPAGLISRIDGDVVRLSATGANAALLDEEQDGTAAD